MRRDEQQQLFTPDDTEKFSEVMLFLRRWNTCSVGRHDWKEWRFTRRCRVCGMKQIVTVRPYDYARNYRWREPDSPNEKGGSTA